MGNPPIVEYEVQLKMAEQTKQSNSKSAMLSFKETIESLVIAFILAFIFRAFVVEAFVIPTGSMADTLRGAHFRLVCPACSYEFNFRFRSNGSERNEVIPNTKQNTYEGFNHSYIPICPMCGTEIDNSKRWVSNGDRILVLKYLYQFTEPKRWDVVVFKNPSDPTENYIKRLIGKPGEEVQILDGDVYIDDEIQRKPKHVQDVLWICAYHSDYQIPSELESNRKKEDWDDPFVPQNPNSAWEFNSATRYFEFAGSETPNLMDFKSDRIKKFTHSFCAYNGQQSYYTAIVSDLKISGLLTPSASQGYLALLLGKYDHTYQAKINFNGQCSISEVDTRKNSIIREITAKKFPALTPGKTIQVSFEVVDHSLRLYLGNEEPLEHFGPNDPKAWGYDFDSQQPQYPTIALVGQGSAFQFKRVAIYRDVHYTNEQHGPEKLKRGTEGLPFTLKKNEFFVLGDNSPESFDSRFWNKTGKRNGKAEPYRMGVVPRDYLIGRAFFVYWPGGFHLADWMPYAVIPNFANMRFIH